jgi:hypothetical protein
MQLTRTGFIERFGGCPVVNSHQKGWQNYEAIHSTNPTGEQKRMEFCKRTLWFFLLFLKGRKF